MRSGAQLHEIEAFLVLAEELHFGRTAGRLGLTHSRVSQLIRMLETRVGGRLFDRTSRRVSITPLGSRLLDEVGPAYRALDGALANTVEAARGIAGVLRIGIYSPVVGGPRLVEIVRHFEERHPDCAVEIVDVGLDDIYAPLRSGELDMLAARLPVDDDLAVGPELSCERRVVAVARDHPLARYDSVTADQVAEHPNGVPPGLPDTVMDSFVPHHTASGRPWRRVPIRTFSEAVVRVALGEIIHPTVEPWIEHYGHPDIVAVPVSDLPPSRTALVWPSAARSPKVAALARTAEDVLATQSHRAAAAYP